jgi:S-formylglutathione hydrolase FrmB
MPGDKTRRLVLLIPLVLAMAAVPARAAPAGVSRIVSAGDWLTLGDAQATLDRLILAGKVPPLIASFPDGNGGLLRDTQFVNSADGKDPVEDFVSKVVPRYVWDHFRAARDPKRMAIGGLSSGSLGALNIGLKHQDVFGCIISFSGYGRIEQNAFSAPFIGGSPT